ncbi:MAG: sensor histidine kinase [Deltaproteobacteria bacterium]
MLSPVKAPSEIERERALSLSASLALLATAVVTLVSVGLALLAIHAVRSDLRRDALNEVALAAESRTQSLSVLFRSQAEQVDRLLAAAVDDCGAGAAADRACLTRDLVRFSQVHRLLGARLDGTGGPPLLVGADVAALEAPRPRKPGQLVWFEPGPPGERSYCLHAERAGLALTARYSPSPIERLFADRHGLGAGGESFLTDAEGLFITRPRHPAASGVSHPIDARPMQDCLAGHASEMVAPDYRGAEMVHGYRPVPDVGGGCVMSHVVLAEAFAPERRLLFRLGLSACAAVGLAALVAFLFAEGLARPLRLLTRHVQTLERGDFSPVLPDPPRAASELRLFWRAFQRMQAALSQSRRDLAESEARNRAVLEQALSAVIGMDEAGRVVDWTPQAEATFGFGREEAMGRFVRDLVIPERHRAAHDRGLSHYLVTGEGPALKRRVEIEARRKDGSELPVELAIAPVTTGGRRLFYAFLEDRTERKHAEDDARFLSEASKLLSASLGLDETLRAVAQMLVPRLADYCSVHLAKDGQALAAIVAHRLPEREKLLQEVYGKGLPAETPRGFSRTLRTGRSELVSEVTDEMLVTGSGGDDWLLERMRALEPKSLVSSPLRARGQVLGALTLVRDRSHDRAPFSETDLPFLEELAARCAFAVDNGRLLDEAREAARLREEFLSIASHELRTPLTALQLQTQIVARKIPALIADEAAREWAAERLSVALRQLGRLTRLVEEMLDLSRIAGERLSLELEPVELGPLVEETVAPLAAGQRAELRLEIPPGLLGRWDRLRVAQIVANLVTNAFRYGEGRPIAITAQALDGFAVLAVRDHGIGIRSEDRERIFARFERAASSRHYGGLGLGLYIVRQIAEALGGSVSVESELGQGSTFTVRLPLAGPPEGQGRSISAAIP